jgi:hypothetical protein
MNAYVRIIIAGTLIGWGTGMAINVFKDLKNDAAMRTAIVGHPIGNDKAFIKEIPPDTV